MDKFTELEAKIQAALPIHLQSEAPELTRILLALTSGETSMEEAGEKTLQDAKLTNALIDLKDSNMGDITIGNVAGGHLIHNLYVTISGLQKMSQPVMAQQIISFQENFTTETVPWSLGTHEKDVGVLDRTIVNGIYRWQIEATGPEVFSSMGKLPELEEFKVSLSTSCDIVKGRINYGLQFGRTRNERYFYYLDTVGAVCLLYYDARTDTYTKLMDRSDAIQLTDINTLKVIVQNKIIQLWINDQLVFRRGVSHEVQGRIALYIATHEGETKATLDIRGFSLSIRE